MAKNSNLTAAARAKKDEFYTQLEDIENELRHEEYREFFRDKTVLCNCDDPYESQFFQYFALNFNALGLKKLIVTCYAGSPVVQTELNFDTGGATFREHRNRYAYKIVIPELRDWNGDGRADLDDIKHYILNHGGCWERLKGNGDFRSPECIELLKQANIVVTNPPFSLFREYVAQLMKYGKKFLILGNKNAVTYKEIFPLIRDNLLWIGVTPMSHEIYFDVPKEYIEDGLAKKKDRTIIQRSGRLMARSPSIWYTNLDHKKRHEKLPLYKKYTPEEFPNYDNYDAINVNTTSDIPYDYDGVMGVPITFLDKYNPEQFEIVGITNHGDMAGIPFRNGICFAEVNGKRMYVRIFIHLRKTK